MGEVKGSFHELLSVLVVLDEDLGLSLNWLRVLVSEHAVEKVEIVMNFVLNLFVFRKKVELVLLLHCFKDQIWEVVFALSQLNYKFFLFFRFSDNKLNFFLIDWDIDFEEPLDSVARILHIFEREIFLIVNAQFIGQVLWYLSPWLFIKCRTSQGDNSLNENLNFSKFLKKILENLVFR